MISHRNNLTDCVRVQVVKNRLSVGALERNTTMLVDKEYLLFVVAVALREALSAAAPLNEHAYKVYRQADASLRFFVEGRRASAPQDHEIRFSFESSAEPCEHLLKVDETGDCRFVYKFYRTIASDAPSSARAHIACDETDGINLSNFFKRFTTPKSELEPMSAEPEDDHGACAVVQ